MDLLKKVIGAGLVLTILGEIPSCLAGHGTSYFQNVPVIVANEGICTINTTSLGGVTISAPFPAQTGGPAEIGVITVNCTVPGKTYAAISSTATGSWDTTATLTGTSGGSVHAEIGKRTGSDTITVPTVVPSAGTVTKMIGSNTGQFDLQLTYTGMTPDSWTLYVLAGRWSD